MARVRQGTLKLKVEQVIRDLLAGPMAFGVRDTYNEMDRGII